MKLSAHLGWRLAYLDYHSAVFLKNDFSPEIKGLTDENLPLLLPKLKNSILKEPVQEQELKTAILNLALKDMGFSKQEK